MNVILIEPPVVRPWNETTGIQCEAPIALLYLGTVLKEKGHTVKIIDAFAEGYHLHCTVKKSLVQIGLDFEQIAKRITPDVDIIGITSNFYFNLLTTLNLGRYLKNKFPRVKIIFGGVAATAMYDKVMAVKEIDFVVMHEAEESLPQLLENVNYPHHVSGVCWRDSDGTIHKNVPREFPDPLDKLPIPDRSLVDLQLYHDIGHPFGYVKEKRFGTTIVTSRGCPKNCTFCSARLIHGKKFRSRSAKNVLSEIEYLAEERGIQELRFIDETFSLNRKRASDIFDGLMDRGYHKNLSLTFPNGLYIDSLDESLIDKMSKCNCHSVSVAIESGNDYVQKNLVKKGIDLKKAEKLIEYFVNATDILVCVFYIIGFPGETKSQIMDTMRFANRVKTQNVKIAILQPYPFTEVYNLAKETGSLLLDENDPEYFYKLMPRWGVISTKEFSPEWLKKIMETDRFLALLRKKRKSLWQLTLELLRRKGWDSLHIAAMIIYHGIKGDLSGEHTE